MEIKEAIEIIERRINNLKKSLPFAEKYINALKMAVDALGENAVEEVE